MKETSKRRRGLLLALTVCALTLLTAACASISLVPEGGGLPSPANGGQPDNRVELELWHTYSDIETKVFTTRVLPLFEEQHPDIRIRAVRKDYTDQLKDDIHAAVADNKQPDIMRMDIIWVPEFARSGALAAISGFDGFGEIEDGFIGSLLQTNKYKDDIYGVPVNANTPAAIFNKELLHAAGLTEPPATFREVAAAAQRLREQDDELYGIGICCSNGWGSLPYFWTFGGQLTDDAYTRADGYLNSEASRKALAQMKDWLERGIISPSILGGEPGTWDGILRGQLLMIDHAHWFFTVNATGPNKDLLDNVVIGRMPSDAAPGTSVIGGENLVLFRSSPHREEAWTFMRWMVSEEPQRIMAETGLIPTIKNLQFTSEHPLLEPYMEQLASADPRPPIPAWTAVEDVFARMLERILSSEQPINEATDRAAAVIDALLAEEPDERDETDKSGQ